MTPAVCPTCGNAIDWTGRVCCHCGHTPTPRRLRFIVNGKAFTTDAKREQIDRLRSAADASGAAVEWRETEAAGDATRFAREAAGADIDTVIAVGGDGTLHEVVHGATEGATRDRLAAVTIGLIPLGTANDFATSAGVSADDPDAALQFILHGKPRAIDVPAVNGHRFINVATGGLLAEATAESTATAKNQLGDLAYFLNGVRKLGLPRPRARLSGPRLHWKGRFDVLAIGNGRQAGGGWKLCRDAQLDDGLLDVLLVPSHFRWGMFALAGLLAIVRGVARLLFLEARREGAVGVFRHGVFGDALSIYRESVIERRVDRLTVQAVEGELQLNLDGEPLRAKAFTIELAARVAMWLPPSQVGG